MIDLKVSGGGSMLRFVSVFMFGFLGLLVSATTISAGDVALIIGNRNYQRASSMNGAERVLNVGTKLRNSGFAVISGRDLSIEQTRGALHGFVSRLSDADRVVIALNGHFVQSDSDTWFVPVNAFPPNPISINYEGLSLQTVLNYAGRVPGGAVVFLGTSDRPISASGGLEPGIGNLTIPQGVLVVTGEPSDIAQTLRQDFLAQGVGFAEALANAPATVSGEGFISDVGVLVPEKVNRGLDERSIDEGYWRALNRLGGEAAMRAYLAEFPDGAHSDEAQRWLDAQVVVTPQDAARAVEADLGLTRKERGKIQENLSLLGYDTRGIDGIFGRGSRRAIGDWQNDRGFDPTGYLTQRQVGRLTRQANRKAEELADEARRKKQELEDADRSFWQTSGAAEGREKGMRRYLRRYPDGLFADVAVARLDAIEEAKRQNVNNKERKVWDNANTANTIAVYQNYIDRFPDGVFADEAKAKIAELQLEEANKLDKEAAKQEEANLNLNPFARVLVEQQLNALGFEAGPTDGKFDKLTRRAIRRFQKARGFTVTGFLTRQTIVRLIAEAG
ncbi:MAG: peptidoglycan hydrolase-like protein with peptidoglycan-binding domain [Paracoccaceae bacterium]|jgi:peptidoglycan hydrolase-like protein with peptidoglycan-binding domain